MIRPRRFPPAGPYRPPTNRNGGINDVEHEPGDVAGPRGARPEIRTIKSGEKTATFSRHHGWRRKDGGTGEATEWHRIVVFGAAVAAVEKLVHAALLIEVAAQGRRDGAKAATEWHRIVVFGARVAVAALSSLAGPGPGWSARAAACRVILIEGRITTRGSKPGHFVREKGESRRVTEIVVAGPQGLVNVLSGYPRPISDDGWRPAPAGTVP